MGLPAQAIPFRDNSCTGRLQSLESRVNRPVELPWNILHTSVKVSLLMMPRRTKKSKTSADHYYPEPSCLDVLPGAAAMLDSWAERCKTTCSHCIKVENNAIESCHAARLDE
jgi:hypothetical protein